MKIVALMFGAGGLNLFLQVKSIKLKRIELAIYATDLNSLNPFLQVKSIKLGLDAGASFRDIFLGLNPFLQVKSIKQQAEQSLRINRRS